MAARDTEQVLVMYRQASSSVIWHGLGELGVLGSGSCLCWHSKKQVMPLYKDMVRQPVPSR